MTTTVKTAADTTNFGGDRALTGFETWLLTPVGLALSRLAILGVFLGVWEWVSVTWSLGFFLSTPTAIGKMLWQWLWDGTLWRNASSTATAMAIGYVLGSILGVVAGLVLGGMDKVNRVVSPFITAIYTLPKIAIAPLLIILLGIGPESKIALAVLTVFFVIMYHTIGGVRDIDGDVVQSVRLMGASELEVAAKVLLPGAMPWIFTGLRLSVRQAFTATVLAELVGANRGLGFLIQSYAGLYNTTGVFAAVVLLTVFSVIVTEALSFLENRSRKAVK